MRVLGGKTGQIGEIIFNAINVAGCCFFCHEIAFFHMFYCDDFYDEIYFVVNNQDWDCTKYRTYDLL